jgi:hypothetical protein
MKIRCLLAVLLVLIFCAAVSAQPADTNKPAAKTGVNSAKSAKDPEAERILKERRDNAQALLISLAADAGRFNDQTLRARTQARIADVLWAADPDRARSLFRKAWESAEIVDQEAQRKLEEDIRQQKAKNGGNGGVTVQGPANIRGEVLRLAAKRDRALGEEFLSKLRIEQQQDASNIADKGHSLDTPEAVSQRLTLARQLLDTDVARALQFADPALTNITRDGLDFLSYLREKDAAAADMRYSAFLARAAADMQSDANTVSWLASYVFTPHMFVTFGATGSNSMSSTSRENLAPQNIPAQLRNSFLRVAGDILMRPLAPPGQDQTSAGIQGKYLMLKRLQPLFDQYAPRELADAIHAQADALAQSVSDDVRQRDDNSLREGIRPPQSSEDREKALQDRIDRAKTAEERDALYIQMARLYVEKGDMRARDFVEKIDDMDLRNKVRPFIDGSLVMKASDKKDIELIFEISKKGDLSHFQRSWALMRAATLLAKTDRDRALATTEDALAEARRIEESDPDRPRAMIAVANALLPLDRAKSWETIYEVVKAANAVETFTGEDGAIRTILQTKGMSSVRSSSAGEFNVAGIFAELAKEDYNKTVEAIRGFQREAPRASATIAIARTVLEDKKN